MAVIIIPFPRTILFFSSIISLTVATSAIRALIDRVVKIYLDFRRSLVVTVGIIFADGVALTFTLISAAIILPANKEPNLLPHIVCAADILILSLVLESSALGYMVRFPSTRNPIGFMNGMKIGLLLLLIKIGVIVLATLFAWTIES